MTDTSLEIIRQSQALRKEVPSILTNTSREVIEYAWLERRKFRIRLKERDKEIGRQIKDLQAERGYLEIEDDYTDASMKELDSRKWEIINGLKDNQSYGNED